MTICIANNEIARLKNAKITKNLADEMRPKAYDLAILNMTRRIRANNDKTPYGIFILTVRGLAQVGVEVSSDAIQKQVKNRRQIDIRRKSDRIYSIYSACSRNWFRPRKGSVAVVWNIRRRGEISPTRNFGGRKRESTLANKKEEGG